MRRNIFLIVFAIAMAACNASAAKQAGTQAGGFALFDGRTAADIVVDPSDYKVVKIAANALAGDVALVAGRKPVVGAKPRKGARRIVIIGTIEKNGLIKKLARENRIDVSGIEGKWETFRIAVVRKPFSGVDSALVVAGSDRRAAAFGAFEISAMMGVSPWVWWADVKPERRKRITIAAGADVFGPPSVKYRGIFINDEDFGLKPWSAKTFEPELGDIGPKTYERVFELLLRLKANHLWPAMHNCTRAFNHYDRNKFAADDYAIVMGSSHCEQMLRNNVDEWDSKIYGEWTYLNNRENLLRYWDERVAANGKFENIYTLGMRAIHDNAMPDGKTAREKVSIVEDVIRDQRAILAKRVDPDVARVPQVFVPYKEVLEQYNAGLKVPEDVTLLWPDDNFGYIRRLPAAEDRKRSGGSGIY